MYVKVYDSLVYLSSELISVYPVQGCGSKALFPNRRTVLYTISLQKSKKYLCLVGKFLSDASLTKTRPCLQEGI